MSGPELHWLPAQPHWSDLLRKAADAGEDAWPELVELANARLDFVQTAKLDRCLQKLFSNAPPAGLATKPVRLAVLGSSTVDHLLPALRVAALRRDLHLTVQTTEYGQYLQELADTSSALHAFKPTAVLLAFDAPSLLGASDVVRNAAEAEAALSAAIERMRTAWRLARDAFGCQIIQQAVVPVFHPLIGNNEHRLSGSPAALIDQLNHRLRQAADESGVDVLALDWYVRDDGLRAWHDPALWLRAKQEVSPLAAPKFGELAVRLLAAQQGRSAKCLVLDLDNTIWGGVIGDDGLDGIVLGQGSALGEAFVAFQRYVRALSQRGVILAVCSKNDEVNALLPFDKHPEMVLRRADIACFVANWSDKASNIREIAQRLNIGLDSLVFVDDNPFERELVRRELRCVAVPELPEDPALFARCIADGGYFETLRVTGEDISRSQQYQANLQRESLARQSTDLDSYLQGLGMKLTWSAFDTVSLPRIVQLINKTNQFNLTTRRYTSADVEAVMTDTTSFGLQFRLADQFGDNGIIAVVIARTGSRAEREMIIDTWLMSCRVLGRQVEQATLNVVASHAAQAGAEALVGEYRPTAKNQMVRDHYARLGFVPCGADATGSSYWRLTLSDFSPKSTFIDIARG